MPGVEILNTTIHYKEVLPTWVLIVIIAIIGIPVVAMLLGPIIRSELLFIIGSISLIFGLCVALVMGTKIRQTTNQIDYIGHEVLINDSVSLTEFLDKYEILDQEGKIYTVKERE